MSAEGDEVEATVGLVVTGLDVGFVIGDWLGLAEGATVGLSVTSFNFKHCNSLSSG